LETSNDPIYGLPIANIKLSQAGPPCFDDAGHSSNKDKLKKGQWVSPLMLDDYDQGCPKVKVN